MPPLEEELSLDVSPALQAVEQIDSALQSVVQGFSASLAAALDILSVPPEAITVPVAGDTTQLIADEEAAEEGMAATVPVDGDTSAFINDVDTAEAGIGNVTIPVDADTGNAQAEFSGLIAEMETESVIVPVETDTSSAITSIQGVGDASAEAAFQGGLLGGVLDDVSQRAQGAGGSLAGVGGALRNIGPAAAGSVGLVAGYGIALQGAASAGAELLGIQQQFEQTFGASAKSLESIDALGLSEDFDALANSLGADDEAMRQVATRTGALLKTFGATEQEAAGMTEEMIALAAGISSVNPAAGDMAAVMDTLTTAVATGRTRGLKRLGIEITPEEIEAQAAALGKTVEQLTAVERQTIMVRLATEQVGDVSDDVAARQQNASVIMAATRERIANLFEEIQKPVAVPIVDALDAIGPLLEALIPLAQRFGDAWAAYIGLTTKMWSLQLQAIGYVAGAAADLVGALDSIPGIGNIVPDDLDDELQGVANAAIDAGRGMLDFGEHGEDTAALLVADLLPAIRDLLDEFNDLAPAMLDTGNSGKDVAEAISGTEGQWNAFYKAMRGEGASEETLAKLFELRQEVLTGATEMRAAAVASGELNEEQARQIAQLPTATAQTEALNEALAYHAAVEEEAAAAAESLDLRNNIAQMETWAGAIATGSMTASEVIAAFAGIDISADQATAFVSQVQSAVSDFVNTVVGGLPTAATAFENYRSGVETAFGGLTSAIDERLAADQAAIDAQKAVAAGAPGAAEAWEAASQKMKEANKGVADAADDLAFATDPQRLIDNLKAQVEAIENWSEHIAVIAFTVGAPLASAIAKMGPDAVADAARGIKEGGEPFKQSLVDVFGGGMTAGMEAIEIAKGLGIPGAVASATTLATDQNAAYNQNLDFFTPTTAAVASATDALDADTSAETSAGNVAARSTAGFGRHFTPEDQAALGMAKTGPAITENVPTKEAEEGGTATSDAFVGGYNPATGTAAETSGLGSVFTTTGAQGLSGVIADAFAGGNAVGVGFVNGLVFGMDFNKWKVEAAGRRTGLAGIKGAAEALDSDSPSKVMIEMGKDTSLGLALGIEAGTPEVVTVSEELAAAVEDAFSGGTQSYSRGSQTTLDYASGIESQVPAVEAAGAAVGQAFMAALAEAARVDAAVDAELAAAMKDLFDTTPDAATLSGWRKPGMMFEDEVMFLGRPVPKDDLDRYTRALEAKSQREWAGAAFAAGMGAARAAPQPAAPTTVNFNVDVNLASASTDDAAQAGRILAESAQRTLAIRGIISRVRTGG